MRRIAATAVVLAMALVVAGCSASVGEPIKQVRASSEFVVLGADGETTGTPASGMPGLASNSVPRDALRGIPGAGDVVVASGTPTITREQAIEKTRPKDGTLVSAVDVVLPPKFLNAVLNAPKRHMQPRTAWIVTWSGVTQVSSGPAGKGADGKPVAGRVRHGSTSVIIDATTGERLLQSEYATP